MPTYRTPLLLYLIMCRYPLPAGSNIHFSLHHPALIVLSPNTYSPCKLLKETFNTGCRIRLSKNVSLYKVTCFDYINKHRLKILWNYFTNLICKCCFQPSTNPHSQGSVPPDYDSTKYDFCETDMFWKGFTRCIIITWWQTVPFLLNQWCSAHFYLIRVYFYFSFQKHNKRWGYVTVIFQNSGKIIWYTK